MTAHRPRPHRDPPTSPRLRSEYDILAGKGALIDDGYYVEPEPLDPRVPEPHRPLPWVGIGCGLFAGIWLAAVVLVFAATLDATPREAPDPPGASPVVAASGVVSV